MSSFAAPRWADQHVTGLELTLLWTVQSDLWCLSLGGKISFIFLRSTVTWIWTVNHPHSTGWTSDECPPIWSSKSRNSPPVFIWLAEQHFSFPAPQVCTLEKAKRLALWPCQGRVLHPRSVLSVMCGKTGNSTDYRFGHLRRKRSWPRKKEGRTDSLPSQPDFSLSEDVSQTAGRKNSKPMCACISVWNSPMFLWNQMWTSGAEFRSLVSSYDSSNRRLLSHILTDIHTRKANKLTIVKLRYF